ncbi:MAG: hypothetical protein AAGA77_23460 [Bacteroidota bacterium]
MKKGYAIAILVICFIWAGMLLGISFLEAPLKFQAPGITLALGLGIGKLVFGAFTKIEMAFALLIIAFLNLNQERRKIWLWFALPIFIVIIDNVLLMPILDHRIEMIQRGETPPASPAHLWYIILEVVKLIALLVGGIKYTLYGWAPKEEMGN